MQNQMQTRFFNKVATLIALMSSKLDVLRTWISTNLSKDIKKADEKFLYPVRTAAKAQSTMLRLRSNCLYLSYIPTETVKATDVALIEGHAAF